MSMKKLIVTALSASVLTGGALYQYNKKDDRVLFHEQQDYSRFNTISADEKVPFNGLPGTKYERTFIMVKPDGVQRQLTSEIIGRFERKGYVLVGAKMIEPDQKLVSKHYEDLAQRPFYNGLVKYMSSSGPVVALVFQGKGVVDYGRVLIGVTDPLKSAPGTIRGDLSVDIGRNTIHGSDGPKAAQDEIALWFKSNEVSSFVNCQQQWVYEK